jgi:hypothetical protein
VEGVESMSDVVKMTLLSGIALLLAAGLAELVWGLE